jgi:hypothetical protein
MKKLFLLLLALLCSCSEQGARKNIQRNYPGSAVEKIPDSEYNWLILKPNGTVWYLHEDGGNYFGNTNAVQLFVGRTIETNFYIQAERNIK